MTGNVIHLGVVDLPYANAPKKNQRKRGKGGTQTTGDVATWLENRYGIMERFVDLHGDDVIVPAMENAIEGQLEQLLLGAPLSASIFGSAEGKIDTAFRKMIDSRELEGLGIAGVPTAAALAGVNHRMKSGYTKGRQRRASFDDTGLYVSSYKTWVD